MLVLALLIMGLVVTWDMALLGRAALELQTSGRALNQVRAFHLSEAGLDASLLQLRANPSYTGTEATAIGNGSGGYSVGIIPLGSSLRLIRTTGWFPSNDPAAYGYAARTIETVVQLAEQPGPGNGVLGDVSARFDGGGGDEAMLDSYDSRQGPYVPDQARANVRLWTNAHEEGAVTLVGGVTIKGDVVLGPGSDPALTLRQTPAGWNAVTGSVSVAEAQASLEPVDMPSLPDGGVLRISGHEVVTLPGGQYRFREIRITGHGQLIFTEPAEVYVDEEVQIAGNGVVTADQRPPNLTFYVTGPHVVVSGQADLYAKIVAPHATVELAGDGDLYGAVSGRDIIVRGQAAVHYDEALTIYDIALNPPRDGDSLQAHALSWREVDP